MNASVSKKESLKKSLKVKSEQPLPTNMLNSDKSDQIYNIDDLSADDLYDSILEINKNPIEPFAFLSNLLDDDIDKSVETTEIENKLAELRKRVELNRILLENTHRYVKDAMFLCENKDFENHDNASLMDNFESELKSTMDETMNILDCVKKISSGEMLYEDLPEDLIKNLKIENQ